MELSLVDETGVRVIEGEPGRRLMTVADDSTLVLEACFSNSVHLVLLYPANLPPAFFDVSSGVAGAILQRLRNYGVHIALVCPPDAVRVSTRFGELLADEARHDYFRMFKTRAAAREWLGGLSQP